MQYINIPMRFVIPAIAIMTLIINGCLMPCQQLVLATIPNYKEVKVVKKGQGNSGEDIILARMSKDTPEGKKLINKFNKIAAREACLSLRNLLAEQNGQVDLSIYSRVKLVFVDAHGDEYSESLLTGDKICIQGDLPTGHRYDLTSYFSEEDQAKIIPYLKTSISPH